MRHFAYTVGLMIVACAVVAQAGNHAPTTQPDDVPFKVVKTVDASLSHVFDATAYQIAIRIDGHNPLPLGGFAPYQGDTQHEHGVDISSIHVHRLKGTPRLLHIEFDNYPEGHGQYQSVFYGVVPADHPAHVLARGSVPLSGHWGVGTGQSGSYHIHYAGGLLTIAESRELRDHRPIARPLYHHRIQVGDVVVTAYSTDIHRRLVRRYRVADGELKLLSAMFSYQIQKGDTLNDILKGFDLKPEWVKSGKPLPAPGHWLEVALPRAVADKRYPPVQGWNIWGE